MADPLPRLVPEPTPESIDEFAALQMEWRRKVSVPDFVLDQNVNRAMVRSLELKELREAQLRVPPESPRYNAMGEQIAEIYADNGSFTLAMMSVQHSRQLLRRYYDLVNAETAADTAQCPHYKGQYFGRQKVESLFIERYVNSQKYGPRTPVLCCNECGYRNMRPLTAEEQARFA